MPEYYAINAVFNERFLPGVERTLHTLGQERYKQHQTLIRTGVTQQNQNGYTRMIDLDVIVDGIAMADKVIYDILAVAQHDSGEPGWIRRTNVDSQTAVVNLDGSLFWQKQMKHARLEGGKERL